MQACDRATTERFGIPSIHLMRTASSAVAAFAREQFPRAHRVTVLCGKGNNGGDGMMAARLLADAGLEVTTLLLGAPERLKGDAASCLERTEQSDTEPDPRRHECQGAGHAQRCAQRRPDCGRGAGHGIQASAQGPGAGWRSNGCGKSRRQRLPRFSPSICPPAGPPMKPARQLPGLCFPPTPSSLLPRPSRRIVFGQLTRRWDQPVVVAPIGSPEAAIRFCAQARVGRLVARAGTGAARAPRPTRATSAMCW